MPPMPTPTLPTPQTPTPPPPPPRPARSVVSLVDALPDDLLIDLASRLFAENVAWFWILSRVCTSFKRAAEEAAGRKTRLGGDDTSVILRRKAPTAPLEPAVPLARLLRHSPGLTTLDLSGGYWWVSAEAAAAIGAAPCARRLRALRLDNCERLVDGDVARMVLLSESRAGWSPRGAPDARPAAAAAAAAARGASARRDQALFSPPLPPPPMPSLPVLRVLSLRACRNLRSAAFLRMLPRLERLDLAWCVHVADLEAHVACAAGLRVLDATGVEHANDRMCARLPGGIEEVRLAMTSVSDEGLALLGDAAAFPALRRVELALRSNNLWAEGLHTDAGVEELRRRRPGAEVELVSA